MLFSSKQKKQNEVTVIFDVGSASVGGALVLFSKDKNPKILYSIRKNIPLQENLDFLKFTDSMIRTLNSVISSIEKKGLDHLNFLKLEDKTINKSFCFLSSPWNISHTKIIEINKEKAFFVTEELMEEVIKKEEDDFILFEKKKYLDILGKGDIYVMDKKIIQIKLNEYKVNNPFDKKINKFEAAIFMSFIDKDLSKKIKKSIGKIFHLDYLYISSFTLPAFSVLRNIFKFQEDFFFLDVSGEITDVSLVIDGVLKETHSFPIGKNNFIREIMKSSNVSNEVAVSSLHNYMFGILDEKTSLKIEESLEKIKKEWIYFLEKEMSELSQGILAPNEVLILADDYIAKLLNSTIRKEKFTKISFPGNDMKLNSAVVDFKKINDLCAIGEGAEKDIFLGSEAVFIADISRFDLV